MSITSTHQTFDYQQFRSLAESDLVAYLEPLVNDPQAVVPLLALEQMVSELETYDEYHLVYAIELGMQHMPSVFAYQIARFLSHDCQSVRLAVHRNLSHLLPAMISDSLIKACEPGFESRKAYPDVNDMAEILRLKKEFALTPDEFGRF